MKNAEDPNLGDLKKLLRRLEKLENAPSETPAAAPSTPAAPPSPPSSVSASAAEAAPAGHALKLQKAILDEPANDVRPDDALARLRKPKLREQMDGRLAPDFPVIVKPDWPLEDAEENATSNKDTVRTVIIASLTAAFVSAMATGAVLVWMGALESPPPTANEKPTAEDSTKTLANAESLLRKPSYSAAATDPTSATNFTTETSPAPSAMTTVEQPAASGQAATERVDEESAAAVLSPSVPAAPSTDPAAEENLPLEQPETGNTAQEPTASSPLAETDAPQASQGPGLDPPRPHLAGQSEEPATEEPSEMSSNAETVTPSNDEQPASSDSVAESAANSDTNSANATATTEEPAAVPDEQPPAQPANQEAPVNNREAERTVAMAVAANNEAPAAAASDEPSTTQSEQPNHSYRPAAELVAADKVAPSEAEVQAQQVANTRSIDAREVEQADKSGITPVEWKTAGILTYAPVTIIETGKPVDMPIAIATHGLAGSGAASPVNGDGSYLIVSGLTRGTRLSSGTELMFDTWRVALANLDDLTITVPESFARRIPVAVELRSQDGTTLDRFEMALEIPKAHSIAFAADAADRAQLPAEVRRFVDTGEVEIANGNLAAARLYFERAANQGSGRAAMLLAASFDPANAKVFKVNSAAPSNTDKAREWYERAGQMGVADATEQLRKFR